MDSSVTPISLSSDSCNGESRCHMSATPAPSTPFPYSPLTPYAHPYPYLTRYASPPSLPPHLHSTYNSSLSASLAASLYPTHDMFHYNPYSALTPTSPLTPSSFWSLTAQQTYHQLSGLSFGPSGLNYNSNSAHLYNLFSPNSMSSLSPNTDSPSLYPRVSSLPTPYSSSPGLSSAFMSPSSMPLLLSPSLSSSVDRPPTYLSDNTSSSSATSAHMESTLTPLTPIKCEPGEVNCLSHNHQNQSNQQLIKSCNASHDVSNHISDERHIERVNNNAINLINNNSVTEHNNNNKAKTKFDTKTNKTLAVDRKQQSSTLSTPQPKPLHTSITTISKAKEKHSARVEPLMRIHETIEKVVSNDCCDLSADLKHRQLNERKSSDDYDIVKSGSFNNGNSNNSCDSNERDSDKADSESPSQSGLINAKVIKQELIECDNSMPSNVKLVPKINDNNVNNSKDDNHIIIKVDNNVSNVNHNINVNNNSNTNLVNDTNKSTNSSSISSDGRDSGSDSKREKDAKIQSTQQQKESQLKQLQSYRHKAESHYINSNTNAVNNKSGAQMAAISIVLPKPKESQVVNCENQTKPNTMTRSTSDQHLVSKTSKIANESDVNHLTRSASNSVPLIESVKPQNQSTLSVTPALTNPLPISNTLTPSQQKLAAVSITSATTATTRTTNLNTNSGTINLTNSQQKLSQQTNSTTKPLPKKPRMSRKHPQSTIPVGIAIAQQRNTSPKTKSPNESSPANVINSSQHPLKPILPTLSLPVMTASSPILITDSPPAGTSLWIKPTPTASPLSTNSSLHSNNSSQFSFASDYQLARDSLTGQLYLIRNSSSLPSTPTTKSPAMMPSLTIKTSDQQKATQSPTILMPTIGTAHHASAAQQFFAAAIGPTPTSTLILDTSSTAPLVQIAASAPITTVIPNMSANTNSVNNAIHNNNMSDIQVKQNVSNIMANNNNSNNAVMLNVERGTQASISDDEAFCSDTMKTTATQVDMDHVHSSEDDDDNDGKRHKMALLRDSKKVSRKSITDEEDDEESSRDSLQLQIVDERVESNVNNNNNFANITNTVDEVIAPVLPVKSAPVMEFIDHHGLDLLVDSIEEFAAREESSASSPVDGLQLLSALAEQRSLEERGTDKSPLRRHSADCAPLLLSTQTSIPVKKRQRSESLFTSANAKIYEFNEKDDDKQDCDLKGFNTSSSQTDMFDRRRRQLFKTGDDKHPKDFNLRRSERIFIHDSVVASKDVPNHLDENHDNAGKNITNNTTCNNNNNVKRRDSEIKLKIKINADNIKAGDNVSVENLSNDLLSKQNKEDVPKVNETKFDKHAIQGKTELKLNLDKKIKVDKDLDITRKHISPKPKAIAQKNNNNLSDCIKSKEKEKVNKKDINSKSSKNFSTINKSDIYDTILAVSVGSDISDETKTDIQKKRKKKIQKPEDVIKIKKYKTEIEVNKDKKVDKTMEDLECTQIKRSVDKDDSNGCDKLVLPNNDSVINKKDRKSDDSISESSFNSEKTDNSLKRKAKLTANNSSFELYDAKRMKLLDETIDEIISKSVILPKIDDTSEKTENLLSQEVTNTSAIVLTPEPSTVTNSSDQSLTVSQNQITSSTASPSLPSSLHLRLSASDLDIKMNVIMLVDGLLFVGEICPIQAPDIYGIILHGERQHRPHIYSQEEMLREAIREVKPELEELREGQRVCAYWSTQYRHLYPGFVRSSSPHPNLVFVEFDDGDNGRIAIDDIRLLPQDYPLMKINADPLKNLERRRRMSSCGKEGRTAKMIDISSDSNNKINKCDIKSSPILMEDNKQKKSLNDTNAASITKSSKDLKTISEDSKSNQNDSSPKKVSISTTTKVSKASNTSYSVKNREAFAQQSGSSLAMKFDVKVRKKKKHTKDDRHHRHHHKHHHCRHHRKCKKHKKTKENSISGSISGNSSDDKETKSTKLVTKISSTRNGSVNSKDLQNKKDLDAQNSRTIGSKESKEEHKKQTKVSVNVGNNNKNINDGIKKLHLKTKIKPMIKTSVKSLSPTKSLTKRCTDRTALTTQKSQTNSSLTSATTTNISLSLNRQKRNINNNKETDPKENSESYSPKKRERLPSSEKSKIAPFLPERQIWHWSGKSIRRTGNKGSRSRKIYYREIERGREHIRVEDCAVFLSTGRPHLPYIGRIDSMWQTGNGTMIVKVRWFYHPEETKGDSVPLIDKRGALFESSHFDVNDVQTISHKCQVISWSEYQQKRRENPLMAFDDPPNIYYLAGQYEALSGRIEMDANVPLKEANKAKEG